MADEPESPRGFLQRWSRRKHEVARAPQAPAAPLPAPGVPAPAAAAQQAAPAPVEALPLPPVESLTSESDFAPFFSAKVDETVKRAALRKLVSDPHFNVMDGLDVYIDDYSKPDPLPEGLLDKLADAYKTLEEKAAEAAPSETVAASNPPPPDAGPAPDSEPGDEDERRG